MKCMLDSEAVLTEVTADEMKQIKEGLTITNPKWEIGTRMGKALWGIPEKLKYYKLVSPTAIVVPIGFVDTLKSAYPTIQITDARTTHPLAYKVPFNGTLYDYQEDATKDMLAQTNGVLCAITGSGKTAMMIYMMCELQQKTLLLVHTIELANQFISSLTKFTGLTKKDVGFIGAGKKEIKDITVGLLQTVTGMDPKILNDNFGAVFVDETHIAPADTYASALSLLTAKYKYGASGTPERADGLSKVIFWLTGGLRHTVPHSKLTNVIIKPSVRVIDTTYTYPLFSTDEYQDMISDLSKDPVRNKLILDTLIDYPTQQICLLCQRKEQVSLLEAAIPGSVTMTSDMGKKSRVAVMKGLLDGTHRVVISTFQLFSTGIDIPTLEVLFMCAPIKSNVKVRQSAGRLMRVTPLLPNKNPIIVDFADKRVELLKHQWYLRSRILRTL